MGLTDTSDIVYLVDLENTGTKILYQHIKQNENAGYIVFCSENTLTPGSILEKVPNTLHITFVDCHSGGNNAMDFCICATAGQLADKKGRQIRILSDDKGYDPMLYMLQQQGVRIRRETTAAYQPVQKTGHKDIILTEQVAEDHTKPQKNTSMIKAIRKQVPKRYQEELIKVIPGALNRQEAHELLQAILPRKMVDDVYKRLKRYIPKETV